MLSGVGDEIVPKEHMRALWEAIARRGEKKKPNGSEYKTGLERAKYMEFESGGHSTFDIFVSRCLTYVWWQMTLVRNQDIGWLLPTLSPVLVVPPQFLVHSHSRNGALSLVLWLIFLFVFTSHTHSFHYSHSSSFFFLFWRQDPHATFLFGAFPVSLPRVHPLLCIIFYRISTFCSYVLCVGVMYAVIEWANQWFCIVFVTSFSSYVKLVYVELTTFFITLVVR